MLDCCTMVIINAIWSEKMVLDCCTMAIINATRTRSSQAASPSMHGNPICSSILEHKSGVGF